MKVGACIRRWRKARGLTQAALAGRARLSRLHVIRIERDEISPTLDTLEKVARALRLRVRDLLPQKREAP
jgi:transcriptional regulator with XRE-family HTH domain